MSTLFMLDTDVVSYVVKGPREIARAKLSRIAPDRICLSAITLAELLFGLSRVSAEHRYHASVRRFIDGLRHLPWPPAAGEHYAAIRNQLTTSGRPIGDMDMLIAAHAIAAGAVLVTNNVRHFERIAAPLAFQAWSAL